MKKLLLMKTMLLLCALIAGSSSVWADVVSGTTYNTPSTSSLPTGWSGSDGGGTSYIKLTASANYIQTSNFTQNGFTSIKIKARKFGGPSDAQALITVSWYDESTSAETVLGTVAPSSTTLTDYTISSPTNPTENTTGYVKIQCKSASSSKGSGVSQVTITYTAPVAAVATPTFSVTAGTYTSTQSVELACETDGATIYYTKGENPADPTVASTEYKGAITVDATTTIKAIAIKGSDESFVASATYTILPVTHAGTALDPYTVTDARNALTAETIDAETDYYVTGYITKKNERVGSKLTYWLSDDGEMTNTIQCYQGKYIDGASFTDANELEVGDIATVKGKLVIYGSTYEFTAGNEVVSITPRTKVNITTFTATTTDLVLGSTTTTTTSVENDQVGWTPASYTYSSDDETVATVDEDGVVTAVAKGTANITVIANVAANSATYKVGDSKSIEITVHNPSHTASFSVNGVVDGDDNDVVEEGEAISFPADPADIGGKKFVGWVEATIDGITEIAPTFVESATMSTSDVTYYAVFASSSTGTVTKTDVINSDLTGIKSNTYSGWSNLQDENGSSAVYAGQCAGSDNTVQLRTNNNNSGIITTTSGGKVKKVVIDWYSGTAKGRTLNIYGKNSAYSFENTGSEVTVSELYNNSKQGTLLGSIVKGTSTELTINDDFTYIGIRSADGALYCNSISIDWETTGTVYSAYCTSIPSSVPVTISAAGLATFASDVALDFTGVTDLEAYIAKEESGAIKLHKVNKVPAGTGVLLRAKNNATDFEVPVATTNDDVTGNLFVRGNDAAVATGSGPYNWILSKKSGVVGFYQANGNTVAKNRAYLQTSTASARISLDFDDNETTGLSEELRMKNEESAAAWYDLQGRKVAQPTKGLYIVNGKKVVIK